MTESETGLPIPWWVPDAESRDQLARELVNEVAPGHPLFGLEPRVVGRCGVCDEVVVRVGDGLFGMVHLTWSGKRERLPWPRYTPTGGFLATEAALTAHGLDHDGG